MNTKKKDFDNYMFVLIYLRIHFHEVKRGERWDISPEKRDDTCSSSQTLSLRHT